MAVASPPKKSDLGVRTLSAIVLLAVAGTALWLGGWWWTLFVAIVALGVLWEWSILMVLPAQSIISVIFWSSFGLVYVGISAVTLYYLRNPPIFGHNKGIELILAVLLPVFATDIGAYFTGRTFGGPKIAPKISPSKTWAGLIGGVLAATLALIAFSWLLYDGDDLPVYAILGAFIAVAAQAGDFFESWMKRRTGVKDSGNLIPGHGGLFDRLDGLLAVLFILGLIIIVLRLSGGL